MINEGKVFNTIMPGHNINSFGLVCLVDIILRAWLNYPLRKTAQNWLHSPELAPFP
jgi:hypothetical protein